MAFYRTRIIKGKKYLYREQRYREGRKVRSKSTYLGAVGAFIGANLSGQRYGYDEEAALRQLAGREVRDEAARQAHLDALHQAYGLKLGPANPTPIEKESPTAVAGGPLVTPSSSETAPPSSQGESEAAVSPR